MYYKREQQKYCCCKKKKNYSSFLISKCKQRCKALNKITKQQPAHIRNIDAEFIWSREINLQIQILWDIDKQNNPMKSLNAKPSQFIQCSDNDPKVLGIWRNIFQLHQLSRHNWHYWENSLSGAFAINYIKLD